MTKVLVVGGTHLGIRGLYREKIFEIGSQDELEGIIREEFNLEGALKGSYITSSDRVVHTLVNEKGETLFEYYVKEMFG